MNKKTEKPKQEYEISKKVIEMDELYSYTTQKNRTYLITFATRKVRQIVGFDIAFDKNENRIQNIGDKALKAKFYFWDANPSYQNVSYWWEYSYFSDKS